MRGNDLGNFFRGMAVYIVQTFLDGIGKALDYLRVLLQIAFLAL